MKNAKKIKNNLTSLFLAFTMILGSVAFAVPGSMPSAAAATENLFVSADNRLFDKSFNGPMVIEVVITDDSIDDVGDLEPDVTINGANLAMIQAGDGSWYAYFAAKDQVIVAEALGIDFGVNNATTDLFTANIDDTVYANATDVVRQYKLIATHSETGAPSATGFEGDYTTNDWPIIQAFDFAVDGSVTIKYSKGGNPQSVQLTYLDDPDDYASLTLDRDSYPPGATVHATITSLSHNIDPTDEDSWTYLTINGTAYYQYVDETGGDSGRTNRSMIIDTSALHFDDSGLFTITANPNGPTVLGFTETADDAGATALGIRNVTQTVTILETQPNSGIFKTTDDADASNIYVLPTAKRGLTGTIDFADSPISVSVRNYPGSLTMDVTGIGGTWNGGEEITVTLDDGDLNLNSLLDQDIKIEILNQKIPTVIIGSPLTLENAAIWTPVTTIVTTQNATDFSANASITPVSNDTVNLQFPSTDLTIDIFSKRAEIKSFSTEFPVVIETAIGINTTTTTTIDPNDVRITFTSEDYFDTTKYFYYLNTIGPLVEITGDIITENTYTTSSTIANGSLTLVADIFRFGQALDEIDSAATTRKADAIYRMLLEETGDNTAMYTGTIEYTALNQLNVRDPNTYSGLATIDDEITIIVPTDLTDEDAVRVDYLDTDGEGLRTQIGAQVGAPTHSGVVSFDAANYKVADTVTVTLTDADLNTNSDTKEVYTSTVDDNGDRVGTQSNQTNSEDAHIGRLVDITFDDATWSLMDCGISGDNGLASTGFVLSETTATSGIFTGTFQIPTNYCTSDTTNSTTTGKDLEVNYVDYSEASGELIEVGDSAGIRANTGSVSFERTVYPVPFDPTEYITQNIGRTLAQEDPSITGNTVLHVRVNDPDYDTSGFGSDTLPADTIKVKLVRGSLKSNNLATDTTLIKEISQSAGVFELDLELGATFFCDNTNPTDSTRNIATTNDNYCNFIALGVPNGTINIRQGDIITVEYTDKTDASGSINTVTDSATFDLRNAVLQTDETAYIVGGDMILTLIEPDFDLDSDQTESYPLNLIEWDSDAGILALGESLNFDPEPSVLRETGDSTGIFQVVIEVPSKLGTNTLERGEQIDLEYVDYGPAGADYVGTDDEDIELTIFTSNFGATISLDQKVYTWTDKVYITITAPDHNFDSDLIDQIGDPEDDNPIKVSTRENRINYYRLVETGTDTGIFTGEVILTGFEHDADGKRGFDAPTQPTTSYDTRTNPAGPTDGYLEAEDDDGITVSFEVSDDETVIGSAIIRWNIGEIEWAEASYSASGNGLVRITDPDLNLNPESVDNFDVDVWSDSDPGGISLTVTETNEATGVFEGQVSFTTTDESSGHRLRVAEGDTITVEYEDHTLPDPYDTSDDLDILSTAIIGSIVAPLERAPVSNARIVDTQGQTLSSVSVDQQVLVSADLRSGQDKDQDYAYLVQIQDADGVTVSLSWITSTLTAGSASSPSQSWTPTVGGDYTATVFVWESITNPTALSASDTVTIQVS